MDTETPLLEVKPSWWNFFWHWFFFWLIVPPIIAAVKRNSTLLQVYEDRVSFTEGFLRKEVTDVFIVDIRGVEVKQGLWQRMFGLGDVFIGTAAVDGWEDAVCGLPGAMKIRDLILERRRKLGAK
jgi:membrane protein YdbS with pleckstrin-like domain